MTERSTRDVVEDHLQQVRTGDIATDLRRNYAEDVVVLTGFGVFRGHDGMREANRLLQRQLSDARYRYRTLLDHGEIAFPEWSAESEHTRVDDGVDSYYVRWPHVVQIIHDTPVPNR